MGTVVLNAKTCEPVMAFTHITTRWLCVLMLATASAHVARYGRLGQQPFRPSAAAVPCWNTRMLELKSPAV